jgi:hypothetical protein
MATLAGPWHPTCYTNGLLKTDFFNSLLNRDLL